MNKSVSKESDEIRLRISKPLPPSCWPHSQSCPWTTLAPTNIPFFSIFTDPCRGGTRTLALSNKPNVFNLAKKTNARNAFNWTLTQPNSPLNIEWIHDSNHERHRHSKTNTNQNFGIEHIENEYQPNQTSNIHHIWYLRAEHLQINIHVKVNETLKAKTKS